MSNLVIAPHCDDEALFAAFIIQRTGAEVCIVTDGNSHEKFGVTAEDRRNESLAACNILGTKIRFLGIPETELNEQNLRPELNLLYWRDWGKIFIPSTQGGNPHHDLISKVAGEIAGDKAIYYGTYTKKNLAPAGEMEIVPTQEELRIKDAALDCYTSQLRINGPHFDAVRGKSEYISFKRE